VRKVLHDPPPPLRDAIVRRAAANDYAVRDFIHAVIQSEAFRSK
jgi:hypothetical protein